MIYKFVTAILTGFLLPQKPFTQPIFPNGPGDGTIEILAGQDVMGQSIDDSSSFSATEHMNMLLSSRSPKIDPFRNFILPARQIKVWLPPGYNDDANSERRYPVLYCHDGQNAIYDTDSWTGHSWRMGGALTHLLRQKLLPEAPIVILIPSMAEDVLPGVKRRHLEYSDGIWGQAYVDAIVDNLKPRVDATYRTKLGAKNTMAIGSSLGGQAAFLSVLRHPDVFGGAAGLSPCFQAGLLSNVVVSGAMLKDKSLYFDNGGDVDDVRVPLLDPFDHLPHWNPGYFWLDTQLQPGVDAMRTALSLHRVSYKFARIPGGRHNEREWARRIDKALFHLFGH